MRITLFIGTLGAGGAERALLVLAEGFYNFGHDVTVLTWINEVSDFYQIPEGVVHVRANLPKNIESTRWFNVVGIIRRLIELRKSIRDTNPAVVISFLDGNNELFLLSSFNEKYKKILSCQNDISVHQHYNRRWESLRGFIYKWADKIVFLDNEQAMHAHKEYSSWDCVGIPNPVVKINLRPNSEALEVIEKIEQYPLRLVAMGRLVNQKGFDLLLDAFANVVESCPDTGLLILGEGHLREDLQDQIMNLGLENNVHMPGQISNPHAVIAKCDLFVFTSRYEGQGLALVEAMACGVPAVSFDCPSGPSYIIRNNVNGLLVELGNIVDFSDSVVMLLKDKAKRLEFSNNTKVVIEKYSILEISKLWESIFQELCGSLN